MLRLILLRHGQTAWNAQKKIMGHADVPLDEVGLAQAREVSSILQPEAIDQIISSPQLRAMETVQILAMQKGLPVIIDPRLSELAFDRWQGKVFDEIKDDPVYIQRRQNMQMQPHEGVETVQEVLQRTKDLLEDLSQRQGCVVCVSHMDTIAALKLHILGLEVEKFFSFETRNAHPEFFVYVDGFWKQERI